MADIPEEHLTEELLDRLLASASIEQYLDEGLVSARTLTDYLFDRMEAHDLRPNGYFVLQAFPNCGANSDATRLSSGVYAMDSTALPRTTSCIVWERRRCYRPIDDIRPNNTHQ